jgi:hypothetical protein
LATFKNLLALVLKDMFIIIDLAQALKTFRLFFLAKTIIESMSQSILSKATVKTDFVWVLRFFEFL